MKTYAIREVFNTLQGEGARAGARSVFVRFAGCNLWDGHPEHRDRGKGACARWCDTDFAKGEKMTAQEVLAAMEAAWPAQDGVSRWCVLSGGEPLLQVDNELLDALEVAEWHLAVETNGSVESDCLDRFDWVCVSPKLGAPLVVMEGEELKVVLPGDVDGAGWTDQALEDMARERLFDHLFVQPQDPIDPRFVQVSHLHGEQYRMDEGQEQFKSNLARCIEFVTRHPDWRLSMQMHKYASLP